jgi:REP element-mobilizing transposase RayT
MVVHAFRDAEHDGLVASLAWVVMPDHFHWLFELKAGSLNELMKRVRGRSAIEINRAKGTEGRVWQKGYHDRAVRYDDDVIAIARYIIANPLRAGIVRRVGDYPLWDAIWL